MDEEELAANFIAIHRALEESVGLLAEIIGAVATACVAKGAIDPEQFRSLIEGLASRPDISKLHRAICERLLTSLP